MALYKWLCVFDRNVSVTPETQRQYNIKPGNFQPLEFTIEASTQDEAIQKAYELLYYQIYGKVLGNKKYVNNPPRTSSGQGRTYKLISIKRL